MTRIGVCMIVRDEEANLPRVLGSVRSVVDEIVVLDTGSTDRTLELARELGARTGSFEWCDDFAAARNAALALATADWVLVLDADEELVDRDTRAVLLAFAARPGRIGQVEIENVGATSGESRVLVSRFFARDGRHRFVGRVHEQLVCDGGTAGASGCGPTDGDGNRGAIGVDIERVPLAVRVRHHGYSAAALAAKDKLARNRALLERTLADSPDDAYAWYQLGRTEHVAGEHARALEAFERALAGVHDDETWAIEALETASYSLRALGRSAQALAVLSAVESRYPNRADTCFLAALLRLDTGDLDGAERGFLRALELGEGPAESGETVLAAASSAPAFNLGVMREVLGDRVAATRWYRRALEFDPEHPDARAGLARVADARD